MDREAPTVHVFVATCRGSERLTREVGLPIVHVDVAIDVVRAIGRLNLYEYGGGVRVPRMFQPLGFESGWDDWRVVDYEPGQWPRRPVALPHGLWVGEGRIAVTLPAGVAIAEFRERLRATLSHLRLQEVTSETAYMNARLDACLDYMVQPRYVAAVPRGDFRDARRVDDLYILDPRDPPWRLFWLVAAARAALVDPL